MTAYATRAPLQLINNPHMMSEPSRGGRRRSSRLEDKEDAPFANGIVHETEPLKGRQNTIGKQGKGAVNGTAAKPAAKRKPGERSWTLQRRIGLLWEFHRGATGAGDFYGNPTD